MNVIFSGVPEDTVQVGTSVLSDDSEKVEFLCNESTSNFESDSIVSCFRIGRPRKGQSRLLKVKFRSLSPNREILRSQKLLRSNTAISSAFGKIFVNPDSSYLARQEDKRLREKLREMKTSASETDHLYIRKGVLYKNNEIIDKSNIVNQLF